MQALCPVFPYSRNAPPRSAVTFDKWELKGMTLIAAQVTHNGIRILADGLSCHDKLSVTPMRRIGNQMVQSYVPGRTTLQKLFPHPRLAWAIAHCGVNQRRGEPVRTIIDRFWHRTESDNCRAEAFIGRFDEEFRKRGSCETIALIGWLKSEVPVFHVIGTDFDRLDDERIWAGSGRNSLSRCWADIASLQSIAEGFLTECQQSAPIDVPFFADCFGGHWHSLELSSSSSARWLVEPRYAGIEVSTLLPGPLRLDNCDDPTCHIITRGEELKDVMRRTFNVKSVRGALERVASDEIRERLARLTAIFDEVRLDSSVATADDAQRYSAAVDDLITKLCTGT